MNEEVFWQIVCACLGAAVVGLYMTAPSRSRGPRTFGDWVIDLALAAWASVMLALIVATVVRV